MSQKKRILKGCVFRSCLFSGCFLDYCQLASVITALTAYCVIDVPCSAVRADCKCRCYCLIVSPSFRSSCLGLPSFRMCHFVLFLLLCYSLSDSRILFNASQRGSEAPASASLLSSSPSSAECSSSFSIMPLLHLPGAWTCLMGIARAMNS